MIKYYRNTAHRVILEKYIMEHAGLMRGEILDIGSKNRRYDNLFNGRVTAVDLVPSKEDGVQFGDATKLEFAHESFDSVASFEMLEYISAKDIEAAVSEMLRVLKKGGCCVFSIPFMYRDHEDRTRLTIGSIREILARSGNNEATIRKIGNSFTVISDIIRIRLMSGGSFFLSKVVTPPVIIFFRLLAGIFSLDRKEDDFYSGIFVVVKKRAS